MKRQLNAHIESAHGVRKVFYCTVCNKSFAKKQSYTAHCKVHEARGELVMEHPPSQPRQKIEHQMETTTVSYKGLQELQQNNDAEVLYLVVDEQGTILQQNDQPFVQATQDHHMFVPHH